MDVVLPLLSTVVSFTFAGVVLAQYLSRRKIYQAVWAFGLVSYGLGALAELLVGIGVWNRAVYSLWYLFGAFFVAAYLGMGTVYLLAPRRIAHVVMGLLLALSAVAVLLVLTAEIDLAQVSASGHLSGRAMPNHVRLLTPIFNIFGTVALVGGAAYSAWVFWRRRLMPQRVLSNVLIAVGALLPAIGSSLLRFDLPDLFYLFELLGVVVIFAGVALSHRLVDGAAGRAQKAYRPST